MEPKITAALHFIKATGKPSVICSLKELNEAIAGVRGTWIVFDHKYSIQDIESIARVI